MKREFARIAPIKRQPTIQPDIAPPSPALIDTPAVTAAESAPAQDELDPVSSSNNSERGHEFGEFGVESKEAVRTMASASGGVPLDGALRGRLEGALRSDLSGVRIHRGPAADRATDRVNAPAVTVGRNIFLGHIAPSLHVPVVAHEAVHVAQQEGTIATADPHPRLGLRSDPEEHEAERAASAVLRGESSTPPISKGRSGAVARRFGAGKYGHGGIESDAAASGGPPVSDPTRDKGVKQMYSGNFMRDMNQLNVPLVMGTLSGLPKDVSSPKGEKIGAKGAHDITTAVIEALAILELGPEVAHSLVTGGEPNAAGQPTPDRIGVYRPEEHIDNPMGMSAKGDTLVTNTDPSKKDDNGAKVEVGAPRPADPVVTADASKPGGVTKPADADRDAQLQGSAVKGTQVENADLYKISGAGLQNHVYNSVEATKKRWLKAAQLGPTPAGRSEFGAGLHAVEDYFSHSNFVEVSLNSYIGEALAKRKDPIATNFAQTVVKQNAGSKNTELTKQGYYVDTLFDAKTAVAGDARKKRQAITTGSFGGTDTKVSIAHILIPQLPKLQKALLQSVDKLFGIAGAPGGDGGWAHLKEFLASDDGGAAAARILEGFSSAGMVAPVPDIELEWKELPLSPAAMAASAIGADQVASALSVRVPTGIKHLSKSLPITDAVATYGGIYKRGKEMVELVQQYEEYAKYLVPFPIAQLMDTINKELTKIDQQLRKEVKGMAVGGLVAIVDSITNRSEAQKAKAKAERKPTDSNNPNEEFEKDLGDALEYMHEGVEALEQTTSLESRLKNGDLSKLPQAEVESRVGPVDKVEEVVSVDPVTKKKTIRTYYVSKKPLPPSHSEVSKDHEPHDEHPSTLDRHHDEGDKEGLEKGSAFFGLARALAVEAVKHSDAQLQAVWSHAQGAGDKSLFGDGQKFEYKSSSDPANSANIHGKLMDEALARTEAEKKRAAKENTSFMGADEKSPEAAALKDPDVAKLISLVDQFISHPDDTQWWKPIVTAYIQKDPQSVYDSILRRNRTRLERNKK
jgi:hypothetical protein